MAGSNFLNARTADLFEPALHEIRPKAASLIVSIYGDAIEPRGGIVWMGNLISICAAFSISETHVRTAVSRLVAAGQLIGEREGRKSYYRLTGEAQQEYLRAANVLFFERPRPERWCFRTVSEPEDEERLRTAGFTPVAAGLWVGPEWIGPSAIAGLPGTSVFQSAQSGNPTAVAAFARAFWALDELGARYDGFLRLFDPWLTQDSIASSLGPEGCFLARVLLVHAYRGILLKDPHLPEDATGADWPGRAARRLFAELYIRLSPPADRYIGASFQTADGALPECTEKSMARLKSLHVLAGS
ncbi:PaaX family transcriptional regulator [Roseibium hamelinense]|uniref:PaaX family transcriptional regulator n=1 Tax=Roseibium hamelinense TaxID=150831 RepID=A0A562TID0_9HYPH|nr:PaaX family transcriptional regulator C-terminal domain-containing protein [Roseibium hamelinense]TWI92928.1 PaaX family transcriptional regulator [Roseibium hamelinense]